MAELDTTGTESADDTPSIDTDAIEQVASKFFSVEPEADSSSAPEEEEETAEDEVEEDGASTTPDPTQAPPSAAPSLPDYFELQPGVQLPRQVIEAYATFDNLVQTDPELATLIQQRLQSLQSPPTTTTPVAGQTPVPAPPTGLTPPDDDDLTDPTISRLWSSIQSQQALIEAQNAQFQSLSQSISRHDNLLYERIAAENQATVNRAVSSFKSQYDLTDEEVTQVRQVAGRLEVLPSLLKGIDPITGQPSRPDPLSASERALEIAMFSMPQYRDKLIEQQATEQRKDHTRKRKLASISGNSGSGPRQPVTPQSESERQQAMINEVAAAMTGNHG